MSAFIIPMGSLPTIQSLQNGQQAQNTQTAGNAGVPFADILQNAVQNLQETGQGAQDTMENLALGATDDLHTSGIAAIKSTTAVNFTSSLVSSVVRAYNELMRMQI